MSTPTEFEGVRDVSERTGLVDVGDTQIWYREAGTGPAIVFIHAGITDNRHWDAQFDALAAEHRVVAYDLRGFGESSLPETTFAHHRDLEAVLDHLDIASAHLVGASMGGAVAIDFTLRYPDRVTSLALFAPALGGYEFTDEATMTCWMAAGEAFEHGDLAEAARIESDQWLAGATRTLDDIDPDVRLRLSRMLRRSYDHRTEGANERDLSPPAIERLDEIQVPVLLVSGALDRPDMHTIASILADELVHVQTETLPDTAHLPSLERPDEVTGLLVDFLETLPAAEN